MVAPVVIGQLHPTGAMGGGEAEAVIPFGRLSVTVVGWVMPSPHAVWPTFVIVRVTVAVVAGGPLGTQFGEIDLAICRSHGVPTTKIRTHD
jgi:hypothetical protein